MPKLIIMRGLPGCGKTTRARQLQEQGLRDGVLFARVNMDELRASIDVGPWDSRKEARVKQAVNAITSIQLKAGVNVINDNTNLPDGKITFWNEFAKNNRAEFEVIDMRDVPVETCLERDAARANPVGSKVILDMVSKFIKQDCGHGLPKPQNDPNKGRAFICDLDGSLFDLVAADGTRRDPYDASTCITDSVVEPVALLTYSLKTCGFMPIFVSGRDDRHESPTRQSLKKAFPPWTIAGIAERNRPGFDPYTYDTQLFMRKTGDSRRDAIVKREIFDREIADKFNIFCVIDDRSQVIQELWNKLGLYVFDVGQGKANF